MGLWDFYSGIVLITLFFYLLIVLLIWLSPFGFIPNTIGWLVYLSFYPLVTMIGSFLQIHKILKQIKHNHINRVNKLVQRAFEDLTDTSTKTNAETLLQIMNIQKQIGDTPEWPLNLVSNLTFLVALIFPTAQIIASYYGIFKP
jgi:hypothetical protein